MFGNGMSWNGTSWLTTHAMVASNPVPAGDRVFALSRAEVWSYFGRNSVLSDPGYGTHPPANYTNAKTAPTAYARTTGAYFDSNAASAFNNNTATWLRSAGSTASTASVVHAGGSVNTYAAVSGTHLCARPALWVKVNP